MRMESNLSAPAALFAPFVLRTPPSAVAGGLRGQTDPKAMLGQLMASHDEFKSKHEGFQNTVQTAIDGIEARLSVMGLGGPGAGADTLPDDPAYSKLFADWARNGINASELRQANREGDRAKINAAMTVSPGEAGGYLAPIEWDRQVRKAQTILSPMRQIATVIPTSVRGYSTVWNKGGWGSGWVGEVASRPTTTTPDLAPLNFAHGEIFAFPALSQQLIDDADFPIEKWVADELSEVFQFQEGPAFLSGDGVNKPRGLLTYITGGASATEHPGGTLSVVPSGNASGLTTEGLVDFVYSLPAPYRQNARWLMNSTTVATINKFKDAGGNFIWQPSYDLGKPDRLLGYPITVDENMPSIAAGALPIAFGDFKRGYVVNDRQGLRILRDPYTMKPYVGFYATKRVGGGVLDPRAIRLLKVAAS